MMMMIKIMYLIILHKAFSQSAVQSPFRVAPIRYSDRLESMDLFYDRILSVVLDVENYKPGTQKVLIGIGVLIDDNRILTSYNPFRELIKSVNFLNNIWVCYLRGRQRGPVNVEQQFYRTECSKVKCGRPVVPMLDNEILEEQWHGPDRKHSPLHDLMVLRLEATINIFTPASDFYSFEDTYPPEYIANGTWVTTGAILTTLADATDIMTRDIRFASVGIYSYAAARRFTWLQTAKYDDRHNVVVNCDEWLPRSWGYFICLWNDELFKGFNSGSMLFSGAILFGIGSFTMWRGNLSILVFTDIRPYLEDIENTCTENDLV